jgi:hypothetical protein
MNFNSRPCENGKFLRILAKKNLGGSHAKRKKAYYQRKVRLKI